MSRSLLMIHSFGCAKILLMNAFFYVIRAVMSPPLQRVGLTGRPNRWLAVSSRVNISA